MTTFIQLNIIFVLAAPFVGSFLALVIHRLPNNEPLVFDRSRCRSCHTALHLPDLFPVLSFVRSRGQCRHCHEKISPVYPAIEIAALVIALISLAISPAEFGWITTLLGWCLLTLAVTDLRNFVLPDRITYPMIAVGILLSPIFNPGNIFGHITGAVAGYLSFFAIAWLYRRLRKRNGLGLGDAKLFAAAGAWLGWEGLPPVLLIASLSGLAFALITRKPSQTLALQKIPFGPFLAIGFWIVWILSSTGTSV